MSQFSRGCNSSKFVKVTPPPCHVRQLPRIVQDESGRDVVVYEVESPVDYGTIGDYVLEDLIANGIQPNRIQTSNSSRIAGSSDIDKFETIAETILADPNSNPTN